MKNILRKQIWYRHIAMFLSLILLLTGAMPVRAVDYVHSEDNLHYLIYTDMSALYEKMVDAYENNNLALIGDNILLPHMEETKITEGIEYIDEIQNNLVDKYLVDTVSVNDNLTVYLTANIATFEFYLLVSNGTEEEHEFQLIFADGMEFEDVATAYSFTVVEIPVEEPLEEEKKLEEGESPAEETPAEETPEVETPEEETPEEETTEVETPVEEKTEVETPGKENLGVETPDEETIGGEQAQAEQPITTELPDEEPVIKISSMGNWNQRNLLGSSALLLNGATGSPLSENSGIPSTEEAGTPSTEEAETPSTEEAETPSTEESETPSTENSGNSPAEEPKIPEEEAGTPPSEEEVPPVEGDSEELLQEPWLGNLEISSFLSTLSLTSNSITLLSSPSTATATQFTYTAGELLPSIDKTGYRNEDGTYTINLSVRGNNDVTIQAKPINLVLALDVSNSMYWDMNDVSLGVGFDVNTEPQHYRWNNPTVRSRWSVLQDAVSKIVSDVIDETLPVNERSQVSIVLFSGNNHLSNSLWDSRNFSILKDWSSDESEIKSAYEDKELYMLTTGSSGNFDNNYGAGGTNGEAGFFAAGLQLEKVKDNGNPNHVVYISDGIANRYLVDNSVVTIQNDTESEFQIAANQAIEVAKSIKSSYDATIYTVGISKALETVRTINGKTYNGPLLCGYLLNPTTPANRYQEAYYTAGDAQSLAEALSNITQNVTSSTLKNLVVTDQLSKYVTLDGGLSEDSNATIDENGTITWNVAGGLSNSETKVLSYRVRVNNAAAYSDASRLIPIEDYRDDNDSLIGYYTREGEDEEKKLYFHSNDYAILDYTNILGEARQMSFRHPVVEPGAPPNILIINKQMRQGDEYPEDIEFQFNVTIDGVPYEGILTSSTGKTRHIQGGQLYLNPNETIYIPIDVDQEKDAVAYEVTEVRYTQEGIESELVDVIISQGNGTRSGYTVSGTLGESGTDGETSAIYYYCSQITKKPKSSGTYEYTWMYSTDNIVWNLLGTTEGTNSTNPTLPDVLLDAEATPIIMYYDSSGNYVANPIDIPLDFVQGDSSGTASLKKVKNYSEAMIFYNNSDYNNENYLYKQNDSYSYNGRSSNLKWINLIKVYQDYGVGYGNVGYKNVEESLGKGKKGKQRHVYFFNPLDDRDVYVIQNETPETPALATNTEITFVNSYAEIKGSITVHKSINDYYSAHGNPTFVYRLDKMNGSDIEETFYDFIEFDITSGGFTKDNITDGSPIQSRDGERAESVLFDELPVGTYILTEQQPIRYEYGDATVGLGDASTDEASSSNNGKIIIIIGSGNTDIEITYYNEKFTNSYFSHTDIVRNRVRIVSAPK